MRPPVVHEQIDRGLGFVCGGQPFGGEYGCGLYFCGEHLSYGAEDEDRNEGRSFMREVDLVTAIRVPFEPKPGHLQAMDRLEDDAYIETASQCVNEECSTQEIKS